MPGGRSFRRAPPSRDVGRKLVIVCEGKKTERGYFEEIRKSRRLPTLKVKVMHADATDPLSIVRAAIEYRQARKDERGGRKKIVRGRSSTATNTATRIQIDGTTPFKSREATTFVSPFPIPALNCGTCCITARTRQE